MSQTTRITLTGFMLAAVMVVAGCSSGGNGAGAVDAAGTQATGDATSTPTQAPLHALDEYLADAMPEKSEDQEREFNDKQQALVAECMTEAGWEYTPLPYFGVPETAASSEDRTSEEWVAQNGYGNALAPTQDENDPTDDGTNDPPTANMVYTATLSETALEAYYISLYGPEVESGDENAEYDWRDFGCEGYAINILYEAQDALTNEFGSLLVAVDEYYGARDSQPEVGALDIAWSNCMADSGYTYPTPADAEAAAAEAAGTLWEQNSLHIEDPQANPAPSAEDMVAVKNAEIDLALADLACKQKLNWDEELQGIYAAQEDQFVKDHKSELEAYKEAALQLGDG